MPHWLDAIKEEVVTNSSLQALQARIQQGEAIGLWKIVEGIILFKGRIYLVPDSKLTTSIINEFHRSTHEGYVKTFKKIKASFH